MSSNHAHPSSPIQVTDFARFERELALNRQAYGQLKEVLRRDFGDQYVAIAEGRLVGAAPTFEAATELIWNLQPRPESFLVFQATEEPAFEIIEDRYVEFVPES